MFRWDELTKSKAFLMLRLPGGLISDVLFDRDTSSHL